MRKILLLLSFFILLTGCKTISVKNKEMTGNIIFKNMMGHSGSVTDVFISGSLKINGVKEIPPSYIKFVSSGNLKTGESSFRISFLNKPIFDIITKGENILLISHTSLQYINLNPEEVNISGLLGINFNPAEVSYFLLGKIPYSENMQMMKFDIEKNRYLLELTDNTSKYDVILNEDEEIIAAKSESQFFDSIILESIKYIKNDDDINIPKYAVFSSENEGRKITLSFLINSISYKKKEFNLLDYSILEKFEEVTDISKIQVKIK